MAVKIRLQRFGRKRHPYYHIVAADSRTPRDGRYIERIGSYNPNTNPASIDLDFEKAVQWVMDGAEPTHTVRQILKYKGVLHKKHLLRGVQKGALNEEEAEKLHSEWIAQKSEKIQTKLDQLSAEENAKLKETLERESKIAEERAEAIRQKRAEQQGSEEEGEAAEAPAEAEENAEAPETANVEASEEKVEESTEEKAKESTESSEPAEAEAKEGEADSEEKKDA